MQFYTYISHIFTNHRSQKCILNSQEMLRTPKCIFITKSIEDISDQLMGMANRHRINFLWTTKRWEKEVLVHASIELIAYSEIQLNSVIIQMRIFVANIFDVIDQCQKWTEAIKWGAHALKRHDISHDTRIRRTIHS